MPTEFDFTYAIQHTEILHAPRQIINPRNETQIDYMLITPLMDNPFQTNVREGTIQTLPVSADPEDELQAGEQEYEGFGPESERYMDFLEQDAEHVRIFQYTYRLKREGYNEYVIDKPIDIVRAEMIERYKHTTNPYAALVQGVEEPWDVCLLHLFMRLVQEAVPKTIEALDKREEDLFVAGLRTNELLAIEFAFSAAEKDPSKRTFLGNLLRKTGFFEQYQDRFFALFQEDK